MAKLAGYLYSVDSFLGSSAPVRQGLFAPSASSLLFYEGKTSKSEMKPDSTAF